MGKIGKIAAGVAAAAVLGTLVFFRLNQKEEIMEAIPDPSVRVENPVKDTIELRSGLTGTISAAESVYVIAMGSGEVLEVYAELGQMVEKDQPLFRIDNKQLEVAQIQMDTLDLQLKDAQTNLGKEREPRKLHC